MTDRIVSASAEHFFPIAAHARAADVAELRAAARATPAECMRRGMAAGPAWTWFHMEQPAAMFGVAPWSILGGIGMPWMVGTDRMHTLRAQKSMVRLARPVIAELRAEWPQMVNAVDERNGAARRWLTWLGFTLHEPQPYGPDGLPFRYFTFGV